MSETNSSTDRNPAPKSTRLTRRGVAAVTGLAFSAGVLGGVAGNAKLQEIQEDNEIYKQLTTGDVQEKYRNNQIDGAEVVQIGPNREMTAWEFADQINEPGNGEIRKLSNQIAHQVGNVVTPQDVVIVSRDDVTESIRTQAEQLGYPED